MGTRAYTIAFVIFIIASAVNHLSLSADKCHTNELFDL